jgi:hypothetical protein
VDLRRQVTPKQRNSKEQLKFFLLFADNFGSDQRIRPPAADAVERFSKFRMIDETFFVKNSTF